jgi:hypothetical protein
MSVLEWFPYLALGWGIMGLAVTLKGESAVKGQYNLITTLWLMVAWAYLAVCVVVFRDVTHIANSMEIFYSIIAFLLSLEVWIIFIGTLIAVALAKKAHDPEFSSLLLPWHLPLIKVFKPLLLVLSTAQIINALYFVLN